MQPSADPHAMSTPRNDPSELDTLSGFLIALQEQDKLLTEAMKANRREISVPHVNFVKRIFDKIGAFDPNLAGPFATHADPATSLAQIRDAMARLKSRAELLEGEDAIRLRKERANLSSLLSQFGQQGEILKGLIPRSASWQGASDSLMNVLQELFAQAAAALPEKGVRFENNNDLDGLRGQITSVEAKIAAGLSALDDTLGEHSSSIIAKAPSVPQLSPANARRVFVIHGRNIAARNALFAFLRSIDLSPIEWEEAVQMTGLTSPYVGQVLDAAFSKSQAAVVLFTGDDMARLGSRYVTNDDPEHERDLTPQARPNVLFEAGMAFGRHPERTVIVAIGQTRPFSDLFGKHIVHLSNSPSSRLRLISRLKTAQCDLQYENRDQWLTEGDFEAANCQPDSPNSHASVRADAAAPQRRIPISDLYYPRLSDEVKEQAARDVQPPNPLMADGSAEYLVASPDGFTVRIVHEQNESIKGLMLSIVNERLSAIGQTRLIIRSAQSFDSNKNAYRDGRTFKPFDNTNPGPIEAGYSGKGIWLVHKRASHPHPFAGNDDQHPLLWPDNDRSTFHRWLVSFEVLALTVPPQNNDPGMQLKTVKQTIVLVWNPSKDEFFIDQHANGNHKA